MVLDSGGFTEGEATTLVADVIISWLKGSVSQVLELALMQRRLFQVALLNDEIGDQFNSFAALQIGENERPLRRILNVSASITPRFTPTRGARSILTA
jgi:hypothetical protein